MALTIRRTGGADYGRFVKALIAGPPGSGKTLLGSTAPDPLIADCEGGLMSVASRQVPYATIETTLDLNHLRAGLDQTPESRKDILGFSPETVIIDTADEVQRLYVRERLKETGNATMTMQDFGWLKDRMLDMIRGYRNLPMNVIFLCHTKEQTDEETGVIYTKPGFQGAVADEIAAYMDIVGLLSVEEYMDVEDDEAVKKVRHVLHLQPTHKVSWLKDRSAKLPPKIVLNGQTDFKRIVATVFADIPEMATEEMSVAVEEGEESEEIEIIQRKPERPADPTKEPETTTTDESNDDKSSENNDEKAKATT